MPINVTKTFLPPFEEYTNTLKQAWNSGWITNGGKLLQQLEQELKELLGVEHLLVCNNGTIVLQMALKALNITGEVITTPFSYVATATAILWENCKPVFVDINNKDFCIDPDKIEAAITDKTTAILATHVYGYPCNLEAIDKIAAKHNLKVIYDGAHAFGCEYKGKSVFDYGDISTCSFHATKLFHMGEGGCLVTRDAALAQQLHLYRQFGHIGDDYYTMGINGKSSELHAALGLSVIKYIDEILEKRRAKWLYYYDALAHSGVQLMQLDNSDITYNYAYFPVVFRSEAEMVTVFEALKAEEIYCRRYFFPSLNKLSYVDYQACPIAESIAERVLCLPLYFDLDQADQDRIIQHLLQNLDGAE